MKIAGLQKMTLLDFPGKVACTVFLAGCNFRCPFCHNSQLLGSEAEEAMTAQELLAFLAKRKGILEGVCITGGEPTLQPDLPQLLRSIKALGYPVKLDTNGSRPHVLKALVAEGLVDYVAMDIKNAPHRYNATIGVVAPLPQLEESIRFLLEGNVDYELRTTVVHPLHDADSILAMGQWLAQLGNGVLPGKLFLQKFVDRDTVLYAGLLPPEEEALQAYRQLLTPYIRDVRIRGE